MLNLFTLHVYIKILNLFYYRQCSVMLAACITQYNSTSIRVIESHLALVNWFRKSHFGTIIKLKLIQYLRIKTQMCIQPTGYWQTMNKQFDCLFFVYNYLMQFFIEFPFRLTHLKAIKIERVKRLVINFYEFVQRFLFINFIPLARVMQGIIIRKIVNM